MFLALPNLLLWLMTFHAFPLPPASVTHLTLWSSWTMLRCVSCTYMALFYTLYWWTKGKNGSLEKNGKHSLPWCFIPWDTQKTPWSLQLIVGKWGLFKFADCWRLQLSFLWPLLILQSSHFYPKDATKNHSSLPSFTTRDVLLFRTHYWLPIPFPIQHKLDCHWFDLHFAGGGQRRQTHAIGF